MNGSKIISLIMYILSALLNPTMYGTWLKLPDCINFKGLVGRNISLTLTFGGSIVGENANIKIPKAVV